MYIPKNSIVKTHSVLINFVNPIKTRISSAWEVKYSDGSKQLLVLDTKFTIIEVMRFIKVYHPKKKFAVSAIDVGVFNLNDTVPIENSYKTDARSMNQDGEIELDFDEN
jgi:hypothetical protein